MPIDADALRAIPLFAAFSGEDLAKLAPRFSELSFPPGHSIAKEGNPGFGFFVIESGSAKVTVRGEERRTLGPGSYFGEIAMLDYGPRAATVTAETSMTAHMLSRLEFRSLVAENPDFALALIKGLWPLLELDDY